MIFSIISTNYMAATTDDLNTMLRVGRLFLALERDGDPRLTELVDKFYDVLDEYVTRNPNIDYFNHRNFTYASKQIIDHLERKHPQLYGAIQKGNF